ncbi:MAG: hypothetical protein LBM96_10835 [Methanobrevibacter sp.]|nr:hypothetical protein [Candidatus Methanoflexus mossambicus]
MSSSGCAKAETLNLTIFDFMKATKNYHNIDITNENITKENIQIAIETLIKQKDIVPSFEIKRQKTNKYYYTFCSPEATTAILNSLILRNYLDFKSRLFKVSGRYFTDRFRELNNKMKLGKAGKYNTFSSHMLRKYHASNLIRANGKGHSLSEQQVDALQGRGKVESRESYLYEDYESLREEYIKCLDNIIIYDDNSINFKTEKYLELEKELRKSEKLIADKDYENQKILNRLNDQESKIEELLQMKELLKNQ